MTNIQNSQFCKDKVNLRISAVHKRHLVLRSNDGYEKNVKNIRFYLIFYTSVP